MDMLLPLIILLTFGRFTGAADFDYDIQGNLYVVDRHANALVKLSPAGDSIAAVSGFGSGDLQFDGPCGVCARQGNDVYVADHNNHRVLRFNRTLDLVAIISSHDDPDPAKRFGYPRDVAATRGGELLVVDGENHRVVKVNAAGQAVRVIGDGNAGVGRLVDPSAVEVDDDDNIYVLDGGAVLRFDPFGAYVTHMVSTTHDEIRSIAVDGNVLLVLAKRPEQSVVDAAVIHLSPGHEDRTESFEGDPHAMHIIGDRFVGLERSRITVYGPDTSGTDGR